MGCGNTWEMESQCAPTAKLGWGNLVLSRLLALGTLLLLTGTGSWSQAGPPSAPCSRRLPWDSSSGWQGAACPLALGDPQERFRNLFSRVKFDSKVKWKFWEVGSVITVSCSGFKTTLGNPGSVSVTLKMCLTKKGLVSELHDGCV